MWDSERYWRKREEKWGRGSWALWVSGKTEGGETEIGGGRQREVESGNKMMTELVFQLNLICAWCCSPGERVCVLSGCYAALPAAIIIGHRRLSRRRTLSDSLCVKREWRHEFASVFQIYFPTCYMCVTKHKPFSQKEWVGAGWEVKICALPEQRLLFNTHNAVGEFLHLSASQWPTNKLSPCCSVNIAVIPASTETVNLVFKFSSLNQFWYTGTFYSDALDPEI